MKPFIYSLCVWLCSVVIGSAIICILLASGPILILSDFEYFGFACFISFIFSIPSFFLLALLTHCLLKTSLSLIKTKALLTIFSAVLVVVPMYLFEGTIDFRIYISYYLPTLTGLWGFKLQASKKGKSLI